MRKSFTEAVVAAAAVNPELDPAGAEAAKRTGTLSFSLAVLTTRPASSSSVLYTTSSRLEAASLETASDRLLDSCFSEYQSAGPRIQRVTWRKYLQQTAVSAGKKERRLAHMLDC